MEFRQLRYFLAVAETRHFGQAADRLHMAQSPLSQAIRQLEGQVGATLFRRTTRRVELTAAGEAFLRDAQRILDQVESAQARVRLIEAGNAGVVRIGATGIAMLRHLPRLARVAARRLPDLILEFTPDLLTPAQERALEEEQIDLAVLRPPLRGADFASRLVDQERLVVVLPDEHRLLAQEAVSLADLRQELFVPYGVPDSVVDSVVTQACHALGFLPRAQHSAPQTTVVLTLVAAGMGVAVLPESVQALRPEGVHFRPVADDVHVDLALAWRADDSSPALARLLAALEADGFLPPGDEDLPLPATTVITPGGGT